MSGRVVGCLNKALYGLRQSPGVFTSFRCKISWGLAKKGELLIRVLSIIGLAWNVR